MPEKTARKKSNKMFLPVLLMILAYYACGDRGEGRVRVASALSLTFNLELEPMPMKMKREREFVRT